MRCYHLHHANKLVAERNFGGAMVQHVIRTTDKHVPLGEVVASRGKVQRAEPVAALYEHGRVSHVGSHPELEDELCHLTGTGFMGDHSPNRADALVWALTDLLVEKRALTI